MKSFLQDRAIYTNLLSPILILKFCSIIFKSQLTFFKIIADL